MRKYAFDAGDAFDIAVGLGLIEGVNQFSTQGFSLELAADIDTDIGLIPGIVPVGGEAEIPFPDNAGEAMEVVSDDPTDTGNIEITALGPNGSFLEPIILQLNGITAVPIPGLISRINFGRNLHPAGFNGTINIQGVGGGTIFSNMLETYQSTMQVRYTVPAGKKGLLKTAVGSMRKQGGTDVAVSMLIHVKPFTFDKWYHPFGFGLQRSGATTIKLENAYPDAIIGPFDIGMSANAGAVGIEAAGRIAGLIIDQ